MRIKIDENIPVDVINVFENAGHNAHSVYSEGIEGCSDRQLITICKKEKSNWYRENFLYKYIVVNKGMPREGMFFIFKWGWYFI